ncbi:14559_t:CDS:2 [Gigaspora margarita]|uniref:14559_t:CDS:1 n=1 Tax=Gigaspora margarita TaxID=4874 RepID=A0ABM8W094_GIGMA|nr:14559_t:CDS:2 [Gigaspora margarita]
MDPDEYLLYLHYLLESKVPCHYTTENIRKLKYKTHHYLMI